MTVGTSIPPICSFREGEQFPLALAVDDSPDNLLVLEYTLIALGFRFIGAMDAIAGLNLARQHRPDVILMDIMLPDVDGIEFIGRIAKEPLLMPVPVIAVTGLASSEDRDRIMQAGFTDYISKPFMLEDLETVIRRHVQLPRHLDGSRLTLES